VQVNDAPGEGAGVQKFEVELLIDQERRLASAEDDRPHEQMDEA
jgi:hypothetical protein